MRSFQAEPAILLVMRKGCGLHGDHIQRMRELGITLHLVTCVPAVRDATDYAQVLYQDPDTPISKLVAKTLRACEVAGVDCVVTFQETDIVLAARVNGLLTGDWNAVRTAQIARDKRLQRELLDRVRLPSVKFAPVRDYHDALSKAASIGYPLVLKPTRAASSLGVTLVRSTDDLRNGFDLIDELVRSKLGYYYDGPLSHGKTVPVGLLEEFVPGPEVTVDGVVLDGRFCLGGIHNKLTSGGPHFVEDLYSLPYKEPSKATEIIAIAQALVDALGLKTALLNVELRQDTAGQFRVIEFSPRISGGHVYRNIRAVHGVDLVEDFARHLVYDDQWLNARPRPRIPRLATCTKTITGRGRVVRNEPGEAAESPYYFGYLPTAPPGARVGRSEGKSEAVGFLSVGVPYAARADIVRAEDVAQAVAPRVLLALE